MPLVLRIRVIDNPDAKLVAMKQGMRNRILRKAVRAGARPVQQAAKKGAPKDTGNLAGSIGTRIATSRKTGTVYAVIGPKRRYVRKVRGRNIIAATWPTTATKIAHLVEFGTKPHVLRKRPNGAEVRHPGSRPRPFLRNAWSVTQGTARARMLAVIRDELGKIMRKKAYMQYINEKYG